MTTFANLILSCDMRKDHYQAIPKFYKVGGLIYDVLCLCLVTPIV